MQHNADSLLLDMPFLICIVYVSRSVVNDCNGAFIPLSFVLTICSLNKKPIREEEEDTSVCLTGADRKYIRVKETDSVKLEKKKTSVFFALMYFLPAPVRQTEV